MSLFDFLKTELQVREWSMTDLARRAGCSKQIVSQWLAENPSERIVPSPQSCQKLASALGVDEDYVLQLAGHRKPRSSQAEPDLIETAIRARMAEMREAVRDTPPEFWGTIIKATFDRAIDGARDMAHILAEGQGGTKFRRGTGPKRQSTDLDTPPDAFGEPLTKSFVRVMGLQTASCSS